MSTNAARFCVEWNRRCERHADLRYRIEDLDRVLPEILERIGFRANPQLLQAVLGAVDRRLNHRHSSLATIKDVRPAALRAELVAMTERYGYPVE